MGTPGHVSPLSPAKLQHTPLALELEQLAEDTRASMSAASSFAKLMNPFLYFFCTSLILTLLNLVTSVISHQSSTWAAESWTLES